jgi:RNA polymerase sigma-70 factor (ECF subfamily)
VDESTDDALVQRAQVGDRAAFTTLVERYQQPLGGYLWRLTRDRELALDLTQETFFRAYRAIASTPSGLLVRPWLYRIATNLAYDELRRRRRLRRVRMLFFLDRLPVEEVGVAIEERELVQMALARLRPRERAVLLLRAVEQLSYGEVAVVLGCSSEAARKQFTRAKEQFRQAYTEITPTPLSPNSSK